MEGRRRRRGREGSWARQEDPRLLRRASSKATSGSWIEARRCRACPRAPNEARRAQPRSPRRKRPLGVWDPVRDAEQDPVAALGRHQVEHRSDRRTCAVARRGGDHHEWEGLRAFRNLARDMVRAEGLDSRAFVITHPSPLAVGAQVAENRGLPRPSKVSHSIDSDPETRRRRRHGGANVESARR
jgi:hypothetical protein